MSTKFSIYKLEFTTGVHFGKGMLNDSDCVFYADQLFSALYIEALKFGKAEIFYEAVRSGRLLFSDVLPFASGRYMIPKPLLYVEPPNKGDSEEKKKYKKLKYIPIEWLQSFLTGELYFEQNPMEDFGEYEQRVMAAVRRKDDTLPYYVGVFHFNPGNGLYVILAYQEYDEKELAEKLLESVSYSGIGGERSNGLGMFELKKAGKGKDMLVKYLEKQSRKKLLLSTALPREDELSHVLEGATYLLGKRSGFVSSVDYADELRRKKDLYVFMAGSCFEKKFDGDIYDVSDGGGHPVYRYAKPLFMGV